MRKCLLILICLSLPAVLMGAGKSKAAPTLAETYGEDYVAYREGRLAEADGNHALAAACYSRIRGGSMLGDAATVYRARCLIRLSKFRGALDLLTEQVESRPRDTYTFEAHLMLAQLQYLEGAGSKDTIARAMATLEQSLAIYPEIEKQHQEAWRRRRNLPALLLLLQDQNPSEKAKDDFGVDTPLALPGSREWPGPERIINRETCEWYLSWIHSQLCLYGAFLELERGNLQEAQKQHSAARAALPLHNQQVQAYLERFAYCLQRGGWLYPQEIQQRLDDYRSYLRLGAYLLINNQAADALAYLKIVSNGKRPRAEELAAAIYGQIAALQKLGRAAEANQLLSTQESLLKQTDLYEPAHLLSQLAW